MNEAALRARSLTLADGQVVVPIEDVLDLAALDAEPLLDELAESPLPGARYAYEVVKRRLAATPSGGPLREALEHIRDRTRDDVPDDWSREAIHDLARRALAATPTGGPLRDHEWCVPHDHVDPTVPVTTPAPRPRHDAFMDEVAAEREAMRERDAATPSGGPLMRYLRHGSTCALQAVRDNAPDDESCTCGLREAFLAATPSGGPLDVERLAEALDDPEQFGWTGLPRYAIAYAAAIRDVQAYLARLTEDAG